jgi:hypothetical protein
MYEYSDFGFTQWQARLGHLALAAMDTAIYNVMPPCLSTMPSRFKPQPWSSA